MMRCPGWWPFHWWKLIGDVDTVIGERWKLKRCRRCGDTQYERIS